MTAPSPRPRRGLLLAAALLVLVPRAAAAESCPHVFASGQAPVLTNPRLGTGAQALCYAAFAILYSPQSRTPLYAAERLTRGGVFAARKVERADSFHEEERLPEPARSRLDDYVRSGFDRGHMAPAGDMPSAAAQAESFTLANIVPQDREANRSIWAAIEESVRRLALERGEIFVVTGPIFEGHSAQALKGRVLVPTQIYKAVYDPRSGEAGAYLAANAGGGAWRRISVAELDRLAGLAVFPALPEAARTRTMDLPEPREFSRDGGASDRGDRDGLEAWLRRELHRLLRALWREVMRAIF
ncbi:DNA/RNA non-specific endonuclease [Methylobacterium organophilum]|uniref:Endonuclease n=1 Tax=Methylobacterium organophilum TaxID=410 RepID=A0ABQ4T923_METOR|nr:DNA/RNA non-specific endonuclease [Methylobacterium organophilum]GJE28167.1 hypothetical protein LKMONMHP_3034 [Methylobacterium organophilum]